MSKIFKKKDLKVESKVYTKNQLLSEDFDFDYRDPEQVQTVGRKSELYDHLRKIEAELAAYTPKGADDLYAQRLVTQAAQIKKTLGITEDEQPLDETTTTASVGGQYVGPSFLAKNKKNWRGGAKPMYPGGKFVNIDQVRFNPGMVESIAEKTGKSVEYVQLMIEEYLLNKNKK